MNLDQQCCLIFVSFDTYDNTEFAGLPLSVHVLMNMEAKCFAVHSHEITDLKHLEQLTSAQLKSALTANISRDTIFLNLLQSSLAEVLD